MENQSSNFDVSSLGEKTVNRRKVVSTAAWSVPVVMAAVATPLASASGEEPEPSYEIQSNFGSGWYPTQQGVTNSGAYQFDAALSDKYLRVAGTKAGDVLSNIYVEFSVTNYPELSFFALPGSNPDWTSPILVSTSTAGGVTTRVYRFTYTKTVAAVGSTTSIPHGFYFRASTPYIANAHVQTSRFVTVNSTAVSVVRNPSPIVNTNVALNNAPRP